MRGGAGGGRWEETREKEEISTSKSVIFSTFSWNERPWRAVVDGGMNERCECQARCGMISIRTEWVQAMWGKRATGHRREKIHADRKREMNDKRVLLSSLVTLTDKWRGAFELGRAYLQTGSLQGRANPLNRSGTNRRAEGPTSMLSGSHISIWIAYPTWKNSPSLVAAYHANS